MLFFINHPLSVITIPGFPRIYLYAYLDFSVLSVHFPSIKFFFCINVELYDSLCYVIMQS